MNSFEEYWSARIVLTDYLLLPVYCIILIFIASRIKLKVLNDAYEKKYFIPGLLVKIIGGIGLCLIYTYYYHEGDTSMYYGYSVAIAKLLFKDPVTFFSILFLPARYDYYCALVDTGDPFLEYYLFYNTQSFIIAKYTTLFAFLGMFRYILMTIVLASISYIGIWKIFRLFISQIEGTKSALVFSFLFIPSVAFWGSGILKDTYTYSATCWFIYCSYNLLISKRRIFWNSTGLIICGYLLLSVRPFMLYIVLLGIIIMLIHYYFFTIKSARLRTALTPVILIVFGGGGILLLSYLGSIAGKEYSSLDKLLEKAYVTQQDLKQEYYCGNSFDIGNFEPTIPSVLSFAPQAVIAGLFRPFIWEARNPVMVVSALENTLLLLLTLYVILVSLITLVKNGLKFMLRNLFDNSLVVFSLVYAIPYAFMIGLSTANFGALVRYKIPLIPFFLASLFVIIHRYNKDKAYISKKESK
ncbi:MAG: hypothetical protein HY738_13000 [Bacteroidia bacterium]|nr:hypothetical protein [Bacteroidia bacterium]